MGSERDERKESVSAPLRTAVGEHMFLGVHNAVGEHITRSGATRAGALPGWCFCFFSVFFFKNRVFILFLKKTKQQYKYLH